MKFLLMLGWFGFFIFVLLPLILSLFRKKDSGRNSMGKGSYMVRDQVCGIYIPKDRAEMVKSKGKVYYFCGKVCQEKFLAGAG